MIIELLKRLNILDHDGSINISHISLAIAIILSAQDPKRETILILFLCLLNLNAKKLFEWLVQRKQSADQERFSEIQVQLDRLNLEFQKLNAATTFQKLGR